MRQFPRTLKTIIETSGLNLNQISQASGISNPYLAKLTRGRINRPGKDKVASIMLALNYSISEIDDVLSSYDYQPLHVDDIPGILKNNTARKIVGGSLPQYDHIYFDLLVLVLEQIGGTRILVKERPSGVFMPHDLYLEKEFPYEESGGAADFRFSLTRAILKERTANFLENLRNGDRSETYICTSCLEEYLKVQLCEDTQKKYPGRREYISQYFANAISLSRKMPGKHDMFLMERCPYFHFLMQDADGKVPKVSYPGRKLHVFDNPHDKRMLEGFTTDLPQVINHFRQEIDMCRGAVSLEVREGGIDYFSDFILRQFTKYGLAETLQADLDILMEGSELIFF